MDAREFEDAVTVCSLLAGPASTQLTIFCAWRVRGRLGALVGGAAFIVPGLIVILVLVTAFVSSPPLAVLGAGPARSPPWRSAPAPHGLPQLAEPRRHLAMAALPGSRPRGRGHGRRVARACAARLRRCGTHGKVRARRFRDSGANKVAAMGSAGPGVSTGDAPGPVGKLRGLAWRCCHLCTRGSRRASGQEIEYPMAVVILGGLATSTLLNLFVLPALHLRVADWRRPPVIQNGLVATPARPRLQQLPSRARGAGRESAGCGGAGCGCGTCLVWSGTTLRLAWLVRPCRVRRARPARTGRRSCPPRDQTAVARCSAYPPPPRLAITI